MSNCKAEKLSLNLNRGFSKEELKQFLSSYNDDEGHHMLWVDWDGNVQIELLSKFTAAGLEEILGNKIKFRYEMWASGKRHIGVEAANDENYVNELYGYLSDDWKNDRRGFRRPRQKKLSCRGNVQGARQSSAGLNDNSSSDEKSSLQQWQEPLWKDSQGKVYYL